ncbi:MAG TPA: hypothetical protein VH184_07225 [Dongiaceae bacterium]|nr:hypothetical protein [Dongiaceae bacterium]
MTDYKTDLKLAMPDGSLLALSGTLQPTGDVPDVPPPEPAAGYDFRSNFDAAPIGPLTTASKHLVWSDPSILSITDSDAAGALWSIVGGGRNGGQCSRAFYQKGKVGEQGFYRLNLPPGQGPVAVEFDWMFESPFDMSGGPGKIGPFIVWGPRSGSAQGINTPLCWSSRITEGPKPWTWALQSRQGSAPSGNGQFIQGWYTDSNITIGQWYHWKMEMLGGASASARLWLDGEELFPPVADMSAVTNADDGIAIEFGFWSGGQNATAYDCWARLDNVRIWTPGGG